MSERDTRLPQEPSLEADVQVLRVVAVVVAPVLQEGEGDTTAEQVRTEAVVAPVAEVPVLVDSVAVLLVRRLDPPRVDLPRAGRANLRA